MRTDRDIERDVEEELRRDPDVDETGMAVTVKDGVATLAGFVHTHAQRREAERVAKRISGVRAVANDIEVRLPMFSGKPDPEIARDLITVLRREFPEIADSIMVSVSDDGWVTLEGAVAWQGQREKVEDITRKVIGVRAITNAIQVVPRTGLNEVKREIEDAFGRIAELDAKQITIETNNGTVTLKGIVRSWREREEAERAAWTTPGVTRVDDQIIVDPDQPLPA